MLFKAKKRSPRLLMVGMVGGFCAGLLFSAGWRTDTTRPALAQATRAGALSVADVAERTVASVVNISATRKAVSRSPAFADPFFREFFRHFGPGMPSPRREQSLGSGVIVSSDGLVVTNNHVIKNAARIRVTVAGKQEYVAKVVGKDPKSDLAVLRLKGAKNLKAINFGNSDKLRLGDVVVAIGNPFGVGQTVTMGIVSAKGRANVGIVDYEDFIQTDAAINPGNSGGALINMSGELIGINTAILSRTGGYQGIGFAIPSNMVKPIMGSLLKRGRVIRGWLGVSIQQVNRDLVRALGLPTAEGVLISDVDPTGPARRAGLKRGDLVVKINGQPVSSVGRLRNLVASAGASAKIQVEFFRRGKKLRSTVRLAELPPKLGSNAAPRTGKLGLAVAELNAQGIRQKYNIPLRLKYGVVVVQLDPSGAAAGAGLREGDVILEANRAKLGSVRRFSEILRNANRKYLFLVYRQGATLYVIVQN